MKAEGSNLVTVESEIWNSLRKFRRKKKITLLVFGIQFAVSKAAWKGTKIYCWPQGETEG